MPTLYRGHRGQPKKHQKGLRPWHEVARLFTEKTGIRMSPANAEMTGARAMVKLRKAMKGAK
jgi:hypothetical protein